MRWKIFKLLGYIMVDNNTPENSTDAVTQALKETFEQLRFVHLRDGIQAHDANRWTSPEVVDLAKSHGEFEDVQRASGIQPQPTELAGGGQAKQPITFLAEDSIENIKSIKEASPDADIMMLYRGTQGLGFEPISVELQEVQLRETVKAGVSTVQAFDMMNDLENLRPGLEIAKTIREEQIAEGVENPLKAVGMISYMSPPSDGTEAAMTNDDYAKYAKNLKELGVDQITIKDYAGQINSAEQIQDLTAAIRKEVGDDIQINLHSHFHKPDVYKAALDSGIDTVDVGIGSLAKGPAQTDAREVIDLLMADKGFNKEDYKDHPVMVAYKEAETRVNDASEKHEPYRVNFTEELQEKIIDSRLAGGAVGAVWAKIDTDGGYENMKNLHWKDLPKDQIPDKKEYFEATLKAVEELWEKSGQINTVTPGSEVLSKQALVLAAHKIADKELPVNAYNQDFKDVMMGRYGTNQGMEKGLGDTELRDAFLQEEREKMNTEQKVTLSGNPLTGEVGKSPEPTTTMKDIRAQVDTIEEDRNITIADKERAAVLITIAGQKDVANMLEYQKTGVVPKLSAINPDRNAVVENLTKDEVAHIVEAQLKTEVLRARISTPEPQENWMDNEPAGLSKIQKPKATESEAPRAEEQKTSWVNKAPSGAKNSNVTERVTVKSNNETMRTAISKTNEGIEALKDTITTNLEAKGFSNDADVVPSKRLDAALEVVDAMTKDARSNAPESQKENIEKNVAILPEVLAAKKEVYRNQATARA
jgi:pyruvate/oxaloacetate carboxyltransferase